MVHNLLGQKNNETISTFQKLQNYCALWKINFKNVITVYKLSIQRMKNTEISWHPNKSFSKENCHPTKLSLFLYQIQHSPKLSASFSFSSYSLCQIQAQLLQHYRSATHNLLDQDIPATRQEQICMGKTLINKHHCIKDWNNLKRDLADILDSEFSLSEIKSYLKQIHFDQYILNFIIIIFTSKCACNRKINTSNNYVLLLI